MSILKVANVHFDSAGTNRIDYLGDDKVRITSANGTVLSGATTDALMRITQTGTGHALVVEDSANPDASPFVVDANGSVLIGTTSARSNFLNASLASAGLQIEGIASTNSSMSIVRDGASSNPPRMFLAKSRGATVGSNGLVQSGDILGSISFEGNDGAEFVEGAKIDSVVDGTAASDSMPSRLEFHTSSAASLIERVRIDSTGNVLIGRTGSTVGLGVKLDVNGAINTSAVLINGSTLSVSEAFNQANTATTNAGNAFGKANSALANTSGAVFSGNLPVLGNVLVNRTTSTVGNNVKLDVNGAINTSAILINGSALAVGGNYVMQVFTANGTWTKPAELKAIKVTVVGGGGGQGGPISAGVRQAGAGGGGTSMSYIPAPSIPGPVTVTVGLGGSVRSVPVSTGETSSFGAFCSATGGQGAGGDGGAGSGGTINIPGGLGSETLSNPTVAIAGAGGAAAVLSSTQGGKASPTGGSVSPNDGNLYGGGSSGRWRNPSSGSSPPNGVGAQGIVIVEEYY